MSLRITRLAPSPTGALHLGNVRTFLINWALARQQGWEIILRIDDLDGPRIKAEAAAEATDDLRWLSMNWDVGPVYQTHDTAPYLAALRQLQTQGEIYPCDCTRSEIAAASAPQEGAHELHYPGTCADRSRDVELALKPSEYCWRVRCPDRERQFQDEFAGAVRANIQQQVGDFVVLTKQGLPSYQLATVIDDARHGVTDIVRGDDLIDSTFRQQHLQSLLGLDVSRLRYWHLPIVVGVDGRRLAKRHGDTRVRHYRDLGVSPQRILGLLRRWCGGADAPCSIDWFRTAFDINRMPRDRIVMTPSDDRWLLNC